MVKEKYIAAINNPEKLLPNDVFALRELVQKYPYFQSARALYLKTLQSQESFRYNNELKITAAHTTNRTILFNFITAPTLNLINNEETPKEEEKKNDPILEQITKSIEQSSPKNKELESVTNAEEKLAIGKPLPFRIDEKHSFNQWLQLSSTNKIVREKTKTTKSTEPKTQSEQDKIIENFIRSSPKISKIDKNAPLEIKVTTNSSNKSLATETLAKVYLEQKKYESAIKAYEILSLKYPEKSGFFADQINLIKILQNNK